MLHLYEIGKLSHKKKHRLSQPGSHLDEKTIASNQLNKKNSYYKIP
jgi:hypothetical protein